MNDQSGKKHWVVQRLTAFVLFIFIPLSIYFVYINRNQTLMGWCNILQNPVVTISFLLLLSSSLYHGKLGVQVIIEDYMHSPCVQKICIFLNNFLFTVCLLTLCLVGVKILKFGFL